MKRIIPFIVLALILGCGPKQNPESKAVIAHFVSNDVKTYLTTIEPGSVNIDAMVATFPVISEKWNSINQRYSLPAKKVERIECALNLHRLILMYFEVPIDEQDLTPEKEKELYSQQREYRKQLYDGISNSHWNRVKEKLKDPVYLDPNRMEAIDTIRQHQGVFISPGSTAVILLANFSEFVETLVELAL